MVTRVSLLAESLARKRGNWGKIAAPASAVAVDLIKLRRFNGEQSQENGDFFMTAY